MLHWWINNGTSFQVHLWTVLKFLTQSNLEAATVPQTINLSFLLSWPSAFHLQCPHPLLSQACAPHWVFFHQWDADTKVSCTHAQTYMGACMHAYNVADTALLLYGSEGQFLEIDTSCTLNNPIHLCLHEHICHIRKWYMGLKGLKILV